MKIITHNEEETMTAGKALAARLQGGEILAISGQLGAGKTCFSKGLAAGLGVKGIVNSPTFNILKVYKARKGEIRRFVHIDAYRLQTESDLVNIGVYDYADKETVIAIEWPENVAGPILDSSRKVSIIDKGEGMREIGI